MKNISIKVLIVISLLLSSCSQNQGVVSHSFLQKRKYNKGWHTNLKKPRFNLNTKGESTVSLTQSPEFLSLETNKDRYLSVELSPVDSNQTQSKKKSVSDKRSTKAENAHFYRDTIKTSTEEPISLVEAPSLIEGGIADDDAEDDVFVYLAFGASLIALVAGIYPVIGILFALMALIFAIVAIAKKEDANFTKWALLASVLALGLNLIWNVIFFSFIFI